MMGLTVGAEFPGLIRLQVVMDIGCAHVLKSRLD